jgi:chaperonin cofactor prefoldin
VIVTADGQEISSGEPGAAPDGAVRRTEGDLLAERRARRAAESGEASLQRRAETVEATVQTLESHVASLQLRLAEAEEERRSVGALLRS